MSPWEISFQMASISWPKFSLILCPKSVQGSHQELGDDLDIFKVRYLWETSRPRKNAYTIKGTYARHCPAEIQFWECFEEAAVPHLT